MDFKRIQKQDFYQEAVKQINMANQSVHFFSVSCCFGFYSQGVKNFESVLASLEGRLKKLYQGRYLDIRCIVKIDHDNQIDMFAAERMAALEERLKKTGDQEGLRQIFKEMQNRREFLQFIIIDKNIVLLTEQQDENYNEVLDLVLNKLEDAQLFKKQDDLERFNELQTLFENSWNSGNKLGITPPDISINKLKYCLDKYQTARGAVFNTERELQLHLAGYLEGKFSPAIISFENPAGSTRIDLAVGQKPQSTKIGIEIKYKPTDKDIDRIIGQMRKYSEEYKHIILVVGRPDYSAQMKLSLEKEMKIINCPLFEYQRK